MSTKDHKTRQYHRSTIWDRQLWTKIKYFWVFTGFSPKGACRKRKWSKTGSLSLLSYSKMQFKQSKMADNHHLKNVKCQISAAISVKFGMTMHISPPNLTDKQKKQKI